jgi:hypothetical protein
VEFATVLIVLYFLREFRVFSLDGAEDLFLYIDETVGFRYS